TSGSGVSPFSSAGASASFDALALVVAFFAGGLSLGSSPFGGAAVSPASRRDIHKKMTMRSPAATAMAICKLFIPPAEYETPAGLGAFPALHRNFRRKSPLAPSPPGRTPRFPFPVVRSSLRRAPHDRSPRRAREPPRARKAGGGSVP